MKELLYKSIGLKRHVGHINSNPDWPSPLDTKKFVLEFRNPYDCAFQFKKHTQ